MYLLLSQSRSQAPYWGESGNETTSAPPPSTSQTPCHSTVSLQPSSPPTHTHISSSPYVTPPHIQPQRNHILPSPPTGESLGMRPLLPLPPLPPKHVILLNQCCLLHHQLSVLPITHIQPHRNHILPSPLPPPPPHTPSQMQHQFVAAELFSLPQRTPSAELQCTCASHQED